MKKKSLTAKKIIHKEVLKSLNNLRILKIYEEFERSLKNNKGRFAVAVSGGPDSLSLAFLAKCFSIIRNESVKYYLVNHNLRNGSLMEAKLVASKLKRFNINCKILNWRGKKPTGNIQSVARKKRYHLLIRQCKKDKVKNLLLGHHVDDLYENFLIRLLRGSGLKGLISFGKKVKLKRENINLLRPLLDLEKKDLISLSKKVFKFYINDPSNLNENFKRVKLRKLISNLKNEGLDKKKLKLTISNLKDSDESINFYVKNNIELNSKLIKKKNILFLNNSFFLQSNEIIFRSLSILMRQISNNYYSARGKSIQQLILKIKSKKMKKVTLGGCFIEKIHETIMISREI